jgi:uncharacterized protein (TIGR03790 family)
LKIGATMLTAIIAAVAWSGCAHVPAPTELDRMDAKRVLVVCNVASSDSKEIAGHYLARRGVPAGNLVRVDTSASDSISPGEFEEGILKKVREAVKKSATRIDFIVLTKGVPFRIGDENGRSVDGQLASMNLAITPIREPKPEEIRRSLNPYFNKDEAFSSDKFGLYLVTRLDGPNVASVKRLVDNSLAARPEKGPFFFDQAANRTNEGYKTLNDALKTASDVLSRRGFVTALEQTGAFAAPTEPLAGYVSWGSNDAGFDLGKYRRLRFLPGAIAETFVSTSARTFAPTDSGQSLVTDLVAQGVTGVKGYVSEPYTFALARPEILFDRYTRGYNLAESFYMASLVTGWKDVVVGDPLCNPYRPQD